jgi:phosphoglycerate dehydrogenase-like enzyme
VLRLTALFTPERADDVVDPQTRQLLEDRFDVVWAAPEHAVGPGSPGRAPALDQAAVPKLVAGADVLLTSWGTPHLGKELWADGNGPKVVAHAAGSVKNLIDPVILEQGVAVFSAGPRIAWSVGEYCLTAMLTLARRLPRFDHAIRQGGWKQTGFRGRELSGAKVGIVGASSTARALISLLKPFGCDVAVYDPYLTPERAAEHLRHHPRPERAGDQGHDHPQADRTAARRRDRGQLLARPGDRPAGAARPRPRRSLVRRSRRLRP